MVYHLKHSSSDNIWPIKKILKKNYSESLRLRDFIKFNRLSGGQAFESALWFMSKSDICGEYKQAYV